MLAIEPDGEGQGWEGLPEGLDVGGTVWTLSNSMKSLKNGPPIARTPAPLMATHTLPKVR